MNSKTKRERQKEALCEQLKKAPIIQLACEKVGLGRATYYRWRKEDKEFAKVADKAIHEGVLFMNDMAESQLLSAIKNQNMTAIIFWLKNRHKSYTQRIEVTTKIDSEELTEEEKKLLKQALQMGALIPNNPSK